ncbi:MAG TPA: CBS domain-containing protein [Polyangiaceae bacterium]|nr:CBS domain-containing protein [Polyangiaceae bacterium]
MHVHEAMTPEVASCSPESTLDRVAQIMWERDCGCVPVTDAEGRVVGVITDRDVCIAAWTQGKRLSEIPTSLVMSREVYTCGPADTLDGAEAVMRQRRVRRLPVVDASGRLVGVLSLGDLAPSQGEGRAATGPGASSVFATLRWVSEPRTQREPKGERAAPPKGGARGATP